jgi:hypothetical protein
MPRVVEKDGRWALMVDGAPYLMLGMQLNNSSAWPGVLDEVWPAVDRLHANTAEAPVYWEQMEPVKGHFDFSVVDALLAGRGSTMCTWCCYGSGRGRMAGRTMCRSG